MVPYLEKRPSEYMAERMWFATQPIEEPDNPQHMIDTIHHIGDDRVIFASDWPHHDFDHPRGITKLPMGNDLKAKIMGLNALKAFPRISAPVEVEG